MDTNIVNKIEELINILEVMLKNCLNDKHMKSILVKSVDWQRYSKKFNTGNFNIIKNKFKTLLNNILNNNTFAINTKIKKQINNEIKTLKVFEDYDIEITTMLTILKLIHTEITKLNEIQKLIRTEILNELKQRGDHV